MAKEPTFKRRARLADDVVALRRVLGLSGLSEPVLEALRAREVQAAAALTEARADYRAELEDCPNCLDGKLVGQWSGCECDKCGTPICY